MRHAARPAVADSIPSMLARVVFLACCIQWLAGYCAPRTQPALRRGHAIKMQWSRKIRGGWRDDEKAKYEELAAKAEAEKARQASEAAQRERDAAEAERARQATEAASFQDNVDLYRPGGVLRQPTNLLTREALENARKTRSPAIDADERLQKAVKDGVAGLSAAEAVELLQQRIGEARAAGVREGTPNLKRALALLATLESGSDTAAQDTSVSDPNRAAFDALFGGGFVEPELDDDLKW